MILFSFVFSIVVIGVVVWAILKGRKGPIKPGSTIPPSSNGNTSSTPSGKPGFKG